MSKINWGPLTPVQAQGVVQDILAEALDMVPDDLLAEAIVTALKENSDVRASVYDAIREEYE